MSDQNILVHLTKIQCSPFQVAPEKENIENTENYLLFQMLQDSRIVCHFFHLFLKYTVQKNFMWNNWNLG